MDFSVLSRYDDILADYFVDNLYLWYNTLRMNGDFVGTIVDKQQIVVRLREHIVEDSLNHLSMKNAADSFLSLPYFQDYAKTFQVKEMYEFTQHMKRYLLMYKHNAGFEVGSTTRYTGKPEACIIATKAWKSGEQVTCCVGSIAALSEQDDLKLKKEGRDFSVMVSTRKKCSCLFLGPARFMNHDCDSNCEFILLGQNSITFRVIKNIKIGEEMTVFYADHYFGENNSECLCCSCERLQQGHFSSQKDDSTVVEDSDSEQIVQNENNGSRRSGRKRKEISYKDFYVPDQVKRGRTTSAESVSGTNTKPMHEITNMESAKEKDEFLDFHSRTKPEEEANSTASLAILSDPRNGLCEYKQDLDKYSSQYNYDQMPTPDSVEAIHISQPMTPETNCIDQTLDSKNIDKNQQLNSEDVNMDELFAPRIGLDSTQNSSNSCRLENGERNSDEIFKDWLDELSEVSDSEENADTKKQLPLKSDLELNCCSDWREFCMTRTSEDCNLCGRCNRHYQIYGLQWPMRKLRRPSGRSKVKGAAKLKLPKAIFPSPSPPTLKDERKPRIKGSSNKQKLSRKSTKKNSIPLANNINSGPIVISTLTLNLSIPAIRTNNITLQNRCKERELAIESETKSFITWRSKRVNNAGILARNVRLMELEERNKTLQALRSRLHQLTYWTYFDQQLPPPPPAPFINLPAKNNTPLKRLLPHKQQFIGPSVNSIAPPAPLPLLSPLPAIADTTAKEVIPSVPLSSPPLSTEVQYDFSPFSKSTESPISHDFCDKDTLPNNLPTKTVKLRKPHASSTTSNDKVPPPPPIKNNFIHEKSQKLAPAKMRKINLKTKKTPLTATNADKKTEPEVNFTLKEKNKIKLKSPVIDVENDFEDEHPIVNTTPILDNYACTNSSIDSSSRPVVNNNEVINEKANKQTESPIETTLDLQERIDNKQAVYFELLRGDLTKPFPSNQHVYIETARESQESKETSCTVDKSAHSKEEQPENFVDKEVSDLNKANDNDEIECGMSSSSYVDTSFPIQSTDGIQPIQSLNIPQVETISKAFQSQEPQSSQGTDTIDTFTHELDQSSLSHQHLDSAISTEIKKEGVISGSENNVKSSNVITDLSHFIAKATNAIEDKLINPGILDISRNQPPCEAQAEFSNKTHEFVNEDIDGQANIVTDQSEEEFTSQVGKVTNQDDEVKSQVDEGDSQASSLATSEVITNEVSNKLTSHVNNEAATEVESEKATSQLVTEVTKKVTPQNDNESDNEVSRIIVNEVSGEVSTDTLDSVDKVHSDIVDEVSSDIVDEVSNNIVDELDNDIVDRNYKDTSNKIDNETNREIDNAIDFELGKEVGFRDFNEIDNQVDNQNGADIEPISEFDAEPISEIDVEPISEIDIEAFSEFDHKFNYEEHFDTTSETVNGFEIEDGNQHTLSRNNRKSDESKVVEKLEPNLVPDLPCVISSEVLVQEAGISGLNDEPFSSQSSTVSNDANSKLSEKSYSTTVVDSDVANREQFEQEDSLKEDPPSPTFTEIMEYAVSPKNTSPTLPLVKEEMLDIPLYFTESESMNDYQHFKKILLNEELEEPNMTDTTASNSFDNAEDEQHSDATVSLDFKSIIDKRKPIDNEPIETPSSSIDFLSIVSGPLPREAMSSMTHRSYFSSIVGSGLQDTYSQTTVSPTLREDQLVGYYPPYYISGSSPQPSNDSYRDSILSFETLISSQNHSEEQSNAVDKNSTVVYNVKKEYNEEEYTQLLQQSSSTIQRPIIQQDEIVKQENSEETYPQHPLPSFKDIINQNHTKNYICPSGSTYQPPTPNENINTPSLLGIATLLSQEKAQSNSVHCQMAPIPNFSRIKEQQTIRQLYRYLRDSNNGSSSRNNESARQTIPQQPPMKVSFLLQSEEAQKEVPKAKNRSKKSKKKKAATETKTEVQIRTMAQTKTVERPKTRSTTAAIQKSSQRPKRKSTSACPIAPPSKKDTTSMTSRRLRPAVKKSTGLNVMNPLTPRDTLPPMLDSTRKPNDSVKL